MSLRENDMDSKPTAESIRKEIEKLGGLTVGELKIKYREVFGEETRSTHKQFLFRRIACRIQANAWGGLSERARQRALEIANDSDLRIRAPKKFLKGIDDARSMELRVPKSCLDPRLPKPGTDLIRRYRGNDVIVRVRDDGAFECSGRIHKSLSKAVTEATGTRWNGFVFFGLGTKPEVAHGAR